MVSAGLLKVNSIVKNNRDKIRGKVYGPLIELFDVEPGYETCVEVAAGSRYKQRMRKQEQRGKENVTNFINQLVPHSC